MTFSVASQGSGWTTEHRAHGAHFSSTEPRQSGVANSPNPLELLLASLSGCMNVILQMVAHENGWPGVRARYDIQGHLDPRGLMGDFEVAPYFQHIELKVFVQGIPIQHLPATKATVDRRCPVHRLIEKAHIDIQEEWYVEN